MKETTYSRQIPEVIKFRCKDAKQWDGEYLLQGKQSSKSKPVYRRLPTKLVQGSSTRVEEQPPLFLEYKSWSWSLTDANHKCLLTRHPDDTSYPMHGRWFFQTGGSVTDKHSIAVVYCCPIEHVNPTCEHIFCDPPEVIDNWAKRRFKFWSPMIAVEIASFLQPSTVCVLPYVDLINYYDDVPFTESQQWKIPPRPKWSLETARPKPPIEKEKKKRRKKKPGKNETIGSAW